MKKNIGFVGVAIAVVSIVLANLIIAIAAPNLFKMSNNVVFISGEPLLSETGEIKGDGSGKDADNPLIPHNYESGYSYLNTALYQATEKLKNSGGTVVIMGRCYFNDIDVCTAKFGENKIVFTSVYNGIDYRKSNDAKIILDGNSSISVLGSSVWENIAFETVTEDRVISFNGYRTEIGNGVECRLSDSKKVNESAYYLSLCAGSMTESSYGQAFFLSIKSGTYHKIVAGIWGENIKQTAEDIHTKLYLGGSVKVLGLISGTAQGKCDFGGSVDITIDDGVYECDIVGAFGSGMTNSDSRVSIKINGGNFSKVWSICDCGVGCKNDSPQYSVLDFSAWRGELSELAYAYNAVNFFHEVLLPDNVTSDELRNFDFESSVETEESGDVEISDITETKTDVSESSEQITEKQGYNDVLLISGWVIITALLVIVSVFARNKRRKNTV
ncbi:MAG: hypothetical protein E7593_03125 [Ruminococcaceae bacterium]|nr:hypothetical protein [Oscillospiraceae bacterium]